jgi:hypothetical protein
VAPAGTIKLPFRKLNSSLCVGWAGGWSCDRSFHGRDAEAPITVSVRDFRWQPLCCSATSLSLSMSLPADNLRRATRIAANGKPEAMEVDDGSHQAQA